MLFNMLVFGKVDFMFQLDFMQNAFAAGLIISILCPFIGLF